MIIRCPECQTRFRLADEKMKPGGTKVRCSRCRQIFTATGPDLPAPAVPPAEEGVDFGAFNMQSVADGEEGSASPPVRTESSAAERESASLVAAPPAGSVDPDEGGSAPSAFDRSDEFSLSLESSANGTDPVGQEDVGAVGGEFSFGQEEEPTTGEFSFGQASDPAVGEEFSFGQEDQSSAGSEFSLGEDEPMTGEFSFGQGNEPAAGGEFSFGEETPESERFSFGDEEAPTGGGEFSFGEEEPDAGGGFGFSFDDAENPLAAQGADGRMDGIDKGGSGEFDFSNMSFGGDQPETVPVHHSEMPPAPRPELPLPALEAARDAEPIPVLAPPVRPRKSPFSGVLPLVVILLLVLAGAAGYFFWQGGAPDLASLVARLTGGGAPQTAGQIRLTSLKGSFVQNREVGPLFVIRGVAVNEYRESRSSIAVKGVLYNTQGQPLVQQTVFSGNTLDEEVLRMLPFVKIEESMNNQFGDSLSNLNVSPGKSIPFTIVFKNLPPDLAEFTVEIADSKPGSG